MLLDLSAVQAKLETLELAAKGSGAPAGSSTEPLPRAAVAVILRTDGNGTQLLVIERATHERDPWSGHLAFPGGRADTGDANGRDTAIRETLEELGLDLRVHGRFLGAWAGVRSAGPGLPNLHIEPYAFAVDQVPPLQLDQREVQRVFWVPVGPLLRGECDTAVEIRRRNQRFSMPGYEVEDRVLWGLSYRMLRSFFNLVHER